MPFPVDAKYIQAAEAELGVSFGPAYRARLLRLNGGEREIGGEGWWLFPVFDRSSRKRISRTTSHVVHQTLRARQSKSGFPPNAVAIAENGSGDNLVLLPRSDDSQSLADCVFRFDHETRALTPTGVRPADL